MTLYALESTALELTDCRLPGIALAVKCGHVTRPLDAAKPAGEKIDIHFALLPAKARKKWPDPVFLLAGGPGQSAIGIASLSSGLLRRLNFRRDIVLVDQRGTGRSVGLGCSELDEWPTHRATEPSDMLPLLQQCRARLVKLHGFGDQDALKHFTTTVAMQDLDAVRAELGAPQINLVGISYGTRAALEYGRLFPERLRRSVLDGVAPPDMGLIDSLALDQQAALNALFSACAKEEACAKAGDLAADWQSLVATLPREIIVPDALSGAPIKLSLTRSMLAAAVSQALYSPVVSAALPVAIRRALKGDFTAFGGLVARMELPKPQRIAMGMHYSVVCAEDYPRLVPASAAASGIMGPAVREMYSAICNQWPIASVAKEFYQIGAATSPVLLLSGGLDPVTPPRHMERIAKSLGAQARTATAPNLGHNVLVNAPCASDIAYGFINARDDSTALEVDGSCLKPIPRPPAFVPLRGREVTP